MTEVLTLVLVLFITILALWQSKVILYALAVPVALVYGFTIAGEQEVYSPLWVAGLAIGLLGLYFLYLIAAEAVGRRKQ